MGTDNLTHLFTHGFFYYNAVRAGKARLEDEDEARRMGLADERGLMGARSTAVINPADAAATAAGYRLAIDYFEGPDPVFSRSLRTGLLRKRRALDVCSYVSPDFDEVLNPPTFTASRKRVARLEAAMGERRDANRRAKDSLSPEQLQAFKDEPIQRSLDPSHGHLPWTYKIYLVFKYFAAYVTVPRESRLPASFLAFPDFRPEHRRPITLLHEDGPAAP